MQDLISTIAILLAVPLTLFLILNPKGRHDPAPLALSSLLAASLELFDLLALHHPAQLHVWKKGSMASEALLAGALLWYASTYARTTESRDISRFSVALLALSPLMAACALLVPSGMLFYSPDFGAEKVLFLDSAGFLFYLVMLVQLVAATIQVEMTLVQATLTSRWKIKLELLGMCSFLAVMIFYYSQGALFRIINMQLASSRSAVLAAAVAMMLYSRITRGTVSTVHVSSRLAYRSVALVAVGIYLAGAGLAGQGMGYFDQGVQQGLGLATLFIAGVILLAAIMSETVKRRITTSIQRNIYRHKYDYRAQWHLFTDRLSSAAEDSAALLHAIIAGFCDTLGMGSGAIYLLRTDCTAYECMAANGMEPGAGIPADAESVRDVASAAGVIDLTCPAPSSQGACRDIERVHSGARYIVPIRSPGGLDGFITLGRPLNPREPYGLEDIDLMSTLARQASFALRSMRLSEQLARSRELAALGKVSSFVIHDLKNLCSSMSLMLTNARQMIADREFQADLLCALEGAVGNMNALIRRLAGLPQKNSLKPEPVDLLQMARETARQVSGVEFEVSGPPVTASVDRDEFGKVLLNLLLNAAEASRQGGTVSVEVGTDGAPYVRVADQGCGMTGDFLRHSLFTPFRSTKESGIGIGLYQTREIVAAHGGRIEVESEPDRGSAFTVRLPAAT